MKHIRLILWKEFAHIRADPFMLRLMIFPVFAQIFIIGYAITTEVRHLPFAVVDRCRTPQSVSLVESFKPGDWFDYYGTVETELELRRLLDNGTVRMGLVIPPPFAVDLGRGASARVQLVTDGVDANSSQVAAGYAQGIANRWAIRHLSRQLRERGMNIEAMIPIQVNVSVLFNPLLKSSWYMIPGLVVLLVTIITSLLGGLSLVREKERGTLEQLLVTPIRPLALVLGKMFPFAIIGLAEVSAFMVLATLWFGIPFRGNPLTIFVFAIIYMLSSLSIGILTSTVARTSQQVLFLTWFVLIFFLLLSGLFIPIENMPPWVQAVTYVNPVRFFITVVRDVFLKGLGMTQLWREAAIMGAIGTVMLSAALMAFKRRAA